MVGPWAPSSPTRKSALNVKQVVNPDTEQEELLSLAGPVVMNTTKDDQECVFETAFVLEKAGMVEISVDKVGGSDPLLAWLGIAEDITKPELPADYAALRKAISDAEKALSNTVVTQEEIDTVLKALQAAESALVEKPTEPEEPDKPTEPEKSVEPEKPADSTAHQKEESGLVKKPEETVELSVTPVPAQGKTYDVNGVLRYKVTKSAAANGTVTVVKLLKKSKTKVVIPAAVKLDGYNFKVTAVSANAFKNCKKLISVTIGKNVMNIGKKAFYKCTKLKTIKLKNPKALKISRQAFKDIYENCKITVPKKMAKKQLTVLKTRMKKSGAGSKVIYKRK